LRAPDVARPDRHNANDYVEVKASGNFSKLLVVKINRE
jgi:hypothetical protein